MSRARVARRIAAGAAYGGGGLGLLGVAAVGVLLAEVQLAKHRVGNHGGDDMPPPRADGVYGRGFAGLGGRVEPLRFAMLGDSTAAGQGVHRAHHTPGALLAAGLAAVAERPVEFRNAALSGARSDDLERQVTQILSDPAWVPDVCVVMIGANDVTHRMPATRSVRCLSAAVRRLRTAGAEVIVGTCPDLGTIQPVYQPLSWLARRASRQLAAAQAIGVLEQGGRAVSLGDLLGPEFAARPRELFGPDNYHPSAEGYATAAMAVLPTLCAVLGVWPEEERPDVARDEGFLPVARAAAEAASEGGTEVSAATSAGTRAPWALLKRRRRRRISSDADAGAAGEATGAGEAGAGGGTGTEGGASSGVPAAPSGPDHAGTVPDGT